jgi:hypothetical protein
VPRGFSAKTLAYDILDRAIEDGRPRVVFMFSDADASGESMPNATARHLESAVRQAENAGEDVPTIYLDPIALDLEQVAEIEAEIGRKIPTAPDVARDEERSNSTPCRSSLRGGSSARSEIGWRSSRPKLTTNRSTRPKTRLSANLTTGSMVSMRS